MGRCEIYAYTILFSGTSWVVTAAHCLHQSLDPDYLVLQDSDLLRPSDFKIIMGE